MQVGFRCTAWFWTARGLVNGQYENLNIQADLAQTDCFAYSRITQAILGTCNQITQTARYLTIYEVFIAMFSFFSFFLV